MSDLRGLADDVPPLVDAADVAPASIPANVKLAEVIEVARRLYSAERAVARAEAVLAEARAARDGLRDVELPNLLIALGLERFALTGGASIALETKYHASISVEWPEERRRVAFDWLEANGYGPVIKHDVHVRFNRGSLENERAREFIDLVRHRYPKQPISDVETVPWQTLSAIVRERVERGQEVPLDALGGFVKRSAVLNLPNATGRGTTPDEAGSRGSKDG